MKLEITNVFEVRRTDGKPITGKLRNALGCFEFNGFWFQSVFEDSFIRVEVFTEEPPAGRFCELIVEV